MSDIIIEQNVPARMRDGVTLYADVYRPSEPGQYAVLLTRSPYGKDTILMNIFQSLHILRAVREGYVVIIQDCRGRFTSEGTFEYCFHEGEDGYDTVEWAAGLPYSSGSVGIFGGSYHGWTQWSAAGLRPPHLKAIAPMHTFSDFSGKDFRGGAFVLGDVLPWRLQMSMGKLTREFTASGHSAEEINGIMPTIMDYLEELNQGNFSEVPLRHLKSLEKIGLADVIGRLLDLGPGNLTPGFHVEYSNIEVPSLNTGGWYDIFQQYTIDNYVGSKTLGRGAARYSHLLVGPWGHGQLLPLVGEMNFGPKVNAAMMDLTGIQLRWFDHWLKNVDNGVENDDPVRIFITGENSWTNMPDWPNPAATEKRLYLRANRQLDFSSPQTDNDSTSYDYDPENPVPTLGGNILLEPRGIKDQRPLSARPDVVTFTGNPIDSQLRVAGHIFADIWISSSAPDTDFVVRLIDIYPDGYMHNLCDGIIRARYRNSLKNPEWLKADEAYDLQIDLWSVAHVFKPGHRIAVQVASSSFPWWDRNWNTTENPGAAISGQIAHQTIWHDSGHPSCFILPVLGS
ncbi:MAG TPA: CocE/NonD family hydrolase [Dehalococcoidia bacterium]|nr:CocE/NonD family hydrolase [Dehalococcoidia bacterium]